MIEKVQKTMSYYMACFVCKRVYPDFGDFHRCPRCGRPTAVCIGECPTTPSGLWR